MKFTRKLGVLSVIILFFFVCISPVSAADPTVKSLEVEKTEAGYTATWNGLSTMVADGYELQVCKNRLFLDVKSFPISNDKETLEKIMAATEPVCYARIRAFKNNGSAKTYYPWSYSSNIVSDTRSPSFTYYVDKNKKKKSLRKIAGNKVGGIDTVQGGCSDGTYSYHALYNRKNGKVQILKTKLSNAKKVKKSKAMKLGHASDMTYDSKNKRIITLDSHSSRFVLAAISPKTLKKTKSITVKIPETLDGASKSKLKKITGFTGIAYDSTRNRYLLALLGRQDILITDASFKPVKYVVMEYTKQGVTFGKGYNSQGITCTKDMILRSRSLGASNLISMYDYDGNFIGGINVNKSYEIENLYIVGKTLYADFYHSWVVTKTRTVKRKVLMTPFKVTQHKPKVKGRIIKVSWKKAKYAQKYQVFAKAGENGKYHCVGTTSAKQFSFKGSKRTRYYIKVRAVNGLAAGKFSEEFTVRTKRKAYSFRNAKGSRKKKIYKKVTVKQKYNVLHRENYVTKFSRL